tara:strand:- start:2413 stop:4233 length:1821 start_codon:yes stop_codon:yes gene_type:complete
MVFRLKNFVFFFIFFLSIFNAQSQNIDADLVKAKNLYSTENYEQAKILFEKIYTKKKTSKIYKSYLSCLIKLAEFQSAIKLAKNFYKKNGKNPSILIDLGELYILNGNEELGIKEFNNVISEIQKKPNFISSAASNFYKKKIYDYALKAYLLAKKNNSNRNYSFQIANIYSQLGQIENMYKELIEILESSPSYLQTCKVRISRTINDDSSNNNNILLKKHIIKKIQKEDNEALNDLLIWIYLQENDFSSALERLISLDKRLEYYDNKIFELGEISCSNKEFEIAQSAFNYLVKKGESSIYYEESIIQLVNIKNVKFKENITKSEKEIEQIIKEHEKVIKLLGKTDETILVLRDLAHIMSFHKNNKEKAKKILLPIIENDNFSDYNIAQLKLELGDIFLSEGNKWDAILYYSQVEKKFKNDIIGQEAKLKKIKVDYFNGDFNWAQAQLDILKKSTSKLVSNNSIELSLLITDNLNLDTTKTALELYAKAELYIFQKKFDDALEIFKEIELNFPDHSLIDEILFKKAQINIEKEKYSQVLFFLEKICTDYGTQSILFDDALFKQGYIQETIFKNYEKAKYKYEKILLEQPGSIFIAEARKRYRKLRNK